jgi:hypothetical protein
VREIVAILALLVPFAASINVSAAEPVGGDERFIGPLKDAFFGEHPVEGTRAARCTERRPDGMARCSIQIYGWRLDSVRFVDWLKGSVARATVKFDLSRFDEAGEVIVSEGSATLVKTKAGWRVQSIP